MIFLFLKAADCIVAVYQHSKGGRLHSADIQGFMVEDREKAGRVNADEPIGLCSAKRGLIEVVIAASIFEIREALADCAFFHAANPKAGKGLFAIRLFICLLYTSLVKYGGLLLLQKLRHLLKTDTVYIVGGVLVVLIDVYKRQDYPT